jgi:hypothetical protein
MMRLQSFLLPVLAVFGLACSSASAETLFVSLRPVAETDSLLVLLGQVAEVAAADLQLAARLRALPVKRLATLTKPGWVDREEILAAMARQGATAGGDVAWGGVSRCEVAGRKQALDLTPGVDAAAVLLMERLGGHRTISIRLIEDGGPVVGVVGGTRIVPDMTGARRIGRFVDVPLRVEVDGVSVARPVARFEVTVLPESVAEELVAAQSSSTSVRRELQELVAAESGEWVVKKDQPVRVIISVGSVRLEGKGIALADARSGESVSVRYRGNGSTLGGQAGGPGLVVVQEN